MEQGTVGSQGAPSAPVTPPKKKFGVRHIVTIIVIGAMLAFGISVAVSQRSEDNAIKENGIETTAVSTGQYMQTREGGRRGDTVYKAQYRFETNSGRMNTLYGEKLFESPSEIVEGETVTIKYLEDEPHRSIVIGEE